MSEQSLESAGVAGRIRARREVLGRSERELAGALGITPTAYARLEELDEELHTVRSVAEALALAALLSTHLLTLYAEPAQAHPIKISLVRQALSVQLSGDAILREILEDQIDWDLGPFIEGVDQWTSVYTLEFMARLAVAMGVDWRRLIAGLPPAPASGV